jgi:glycosyltransferase involved in cell wall biosynthesis
MKIYFHNHAPQTHSLYKSLFSQPPQGYEFIQEKKTEGIQALNKNSLLWKVNLKVLKKVVNTVAIKDFIFRFKKIDADLIYSSGYLIYAKQPWIMDFEFASSVTGYDNKRFVKKKSQIKNVLLSPYCKALLPWNEWAKETLLASIDTPEIRKKTHVVYIAIPPPVLKEKIPHKKITMLFLGSANLPKDFYHKGGKAAIRVYLELKKKHDIKLIMRCSIPEELKGWIPNDPDLEIIDRMLSVEELNNVFLRSDILIAPAAQTPALVFLEAMGRKMPVVTTNVTFASEIITHNEDGIVVEKPDIKYYEMERLPMGTWDWPDTRTYDQDEEFIKRFSAGVEVLIKKPSLIKKYGENGREKIVSGKFSIQERNKKLKQIFDDALK